MQIHEGESKFAKLNKLERDCESATEIRSSGCKDEQISKTTTNPVQQSGRLQQALLDHDAHAEKSIALAQAGICCFVLGIHLIAQNSSG
jgi:hypothetical protein